MSISGITSTGTLSGYEYGKRCSSRKEETPDFLQAIEEKAEGTDAKKDYAAQAFDKVGPNAPESVRKAWMEAAKEVGANGLGIKSNGMLGHISQMMVQRLTNQLQGRANPDDILGSSVTSAMAAVKKAIVDLDNPRRQGSKSIEVQRLEMKERQFYQTFLDKLQHL